MKSRVTARPAEREEMPDKRWQGRRRREKEGGGGRKRRRGEGRGVGEAHSARENVKTESIHKAEKLNVRGWR